jgi:hypothetical protein
MTVFDELVKSRQSVLFVIPAKAGIQSSPLVREALDSGACPDHGRGKLLPQNGILFSFALKIFTMNRTLTPVTKT